MEGRGDVKAKAKEPECKKKKNTIALTEEVMAARLYKDSSIRLYNILTGSERL